jgi:membrane-associated phospholipid phosphatase
MFGFSAATLNITSHTLCTWDFSSSLEIDNNITNPNSSSPNPVPNHGKNNTFRLVMGFGAVGFVLIGGLALVLFALWKRNRKDKEEDHALDDYIDEDFAKETGP